MINDQQILQAAQLDNPTDKYAIRQFAGGCRALERFLNVMPGNWTLITANLAASPTGSAAALFEIKPEQSA